MASPLGHALAGYAIYRCNRSVRTHNHTVWLYLIMAIAPDLDFIPGILQGRPNLYTKEFRTASELRWLSVWLQRLLSARATYGSTGGCY
jgi:hypothetical protein